MVFDSRSGFQLDDSEIPVSHQLCQKTKIDRSADHHCNGKGVMGRWPCAQGSVEPEKPSSRLRSVGNSPGDETGRSVILAPKHAGAYHFNFAGTARNLSNISLIRLGLSSLTFFNIAPI